MRRSRLRIRDEPSSDPLLGSRLHIAVLASIAAGLAWAAGNMVPSPIGDYAYYAPLGAVLAINPTLANSVRRSLQLFGALLLGAALGVLIDLVPVSLPGPVGVAIIVFLAVGASAWDLLGDERSWVMTGALFTYVLGRVDPSDFVAGLVVQVSVGALIGLVLTLVLPPMPLALARRRLKATSEEIAQQLDLIAEALSEDEEYEREQLVREMIPDLERLRTTIDALDESTIGNVRARRYRGHVERHRVRGDVLVRVGSVVENLSYMLVEVQSSGRPWLSRGSDLARSVAATMQELATIVRAIGEDQEVPEKERRDLEQRTDDLEAAVQRDSDETSLPGAALVVSLRRCLGSLDPEGETPVFKPLTSPGHRAARRRRFLRRR